MMPFQVESVFEIISGVTLVLLLIGLLFKVLINVKADEIAIIERQFFGKELAKGRVFALADEVGIRTRYLSPGLHFIFWPIVTLRYKARFVSIAADELGIVDATDGQPLPPGRIFADDPSGDHHDHFQDPSQFLLNGGIRGKQLRVLTNGTFKIHPELFTVTKIKKTTIPEGSIGVVTAADGKPLEGNLLARSIPDHDNFQKADMFLKNGGQKGPQIDYLRPGVYNINTDMFSIEIHPAIQINENEIGIVEARDGLPMNRDEVVVHSPDDHRYFQDGQYFLDAGGKRGPQESILTPGTYYINPYLFSVSKRSQTTVAQGEVAVLISNVGSAYIPDVTQVDLSANRHVVPKGFRGIQETALGPGSYNINTLAYSVVIVPTITLSVDWSAEGVKNNPDRSFDPFQVVSHDGFPMQVEVRCQYRVLPENAPFVVQKIGSINELESNVIHPQIDGIFRAQVSKSPAISYQQNRAEEQKAAEEAVRTDLSKYRVDVVSVMITNIHLPEALMKTTQQKNLAEQEKSMYDAKKEAEQQRIAFEKMKAEANVQSTIINAESGIKVAQHEARQMEERAKGDAARIRVNAEADSAHIKQMGDAEAEVVRLKGEAQAKAYRDQVEALTSEGVTTIELIKQIAGAGLKITPEIQISGGTGNDGTAGLLQLLLTQMVQKRAARSTSGNGIEN